MFIFGKFLYSVRALEELVLYCSNDNEKYIVQGIINNDYGINGNIFKKIPSEKVSGILDAINNDISCNNISEKIKIAFPKEEKYGVLVLSGKIFLENKTVLAKKSFDMKYGEAVFETAMQKWLNSGEKYCCVYENTIELIGTVLKPIRVGEKLMLINDFTEFAPSIFNVDKIIYRNRFIDEIDPSMRCCKIILNGRISSITERALFVEA